MQHAQ